MVKRRSTRTRRRKHRGGFLEGVTSALSDAATSVGNALSGKSSPAPVTVGEKAAAIPAASAALDGAQGVADTLPSVANSNASAALGLPKPTPGYTSAGGRRRRSRKTRRRRGGKYY